MNANLLARLWRLGRSTPKYKALGDHATTSDVKISSRVKRILKKCETYLASANYDTSKMTTFQIALTYLMITELRYSDSTPVKGSQVSHLLVYTRSVLVQANKFTLEEVLAVEKAIPMEFWTIWILAGKVPLNSDIIDNIIKNKSYCQELLDGRLETLTLSQFYSVIEGMEFLPILPKQAPEGTDWVKVVDSTIDNLLGVLSVVEEERYCYLNRIISWVERIENMITQTRMALNLGDLPDEWVLHAVGFKRPAVVWEFLIESRQLLETLEQASQIWTE